MPLAIVLTPAVAGLLAMMIRPHRPRRALLVAAALAHSILAVASWWAGSAAMFGGWLAFDAPGLLFLTLTSVLFLAAAVYGVGYLARESPGLHRDFEEEALFRNEPEAIFTAALLLFLAAMTLVTVSQHFGVLWIALEATTLASAPLIAFHRHHRSLEATWKFLLIGSVGIAVALLGNFFLAVAAAGPGGRDGSIVLRDLVQRADALHGPWLRAAFICFLVGYGTKMGLAPMHTWLPDAHSEAPSLVSALLSGALLNCAFLGILRALQVLMAAGQKEFGLELLIGFGLVSMAVASIFIIRQGDFKRLLAYSSVEHMGILALAVGLSQSATNGAMLHAVNHSLTKAMLFLVAGNILAVYRTKSTTEVHGVLRVLPVSGFIWIAGLFAISGTPPFATFFSEFAVLKSALDQGKTVVAALYLMLLGIVFIGTATVVLRMAQGAPPQAPTAPRSGWIAYLPPAVLGAAVLGLGLYMPQFVSDAVNGAARALGGA